MFAIISSTTAIYRESTLLSNIKPTLLYSKLLNERQAVSTGH